MAVNTSIWKDTYYAISSANSPYVYSIELKTGNQITVNGSTTDEVITVFNGKSWVRPGEANINININRIAQDYLSSDLPDLRNISTTTTYIDKLAYRQFYLKSSGGTTVQTYNFLNDWSYENTDLSGNVNLSNPINGHGTTNMLFLSSEFVNSSQNVVTTIAVSPSSGYDNTYCGEYALYYLTRKGGWCSFLFEGNCTKTDSYTRYNISQPYNNTTLEFQKKTYHNEIVTSYKIYTGWLRDSESLNFAENLIGTNKAYLHNLATGEIMPVLSIDSTATYKTWRNQGRKAPVNYVVTLECSQTKHNAG